MARKRKNQKSTPSVIRLISKDGKEQDFKTLHAVRLLGYPNSSWKKVEANLPQEDDSQTD